LFLTALITGGLVWLTFGLCLLMARHSATIYDDHLLFELFGKRYTVFYDDLYWVDVVLTDGYYSRYYQLWIASKGAADRPLYVNLELFGRKDRKLLLRTIATCAPQARLNDLALEFATARRSR